jgi:hypothetical protein
VALLGCPKTSRFKKMDAAGALSLLGMYAPALQFSAPFLTIFLGFFAD